MVASDPVQHRGRIIRALRSASLRELPKEEVRVEYERSGPIICFSEAVKQGGFSWSESFSPGKGSFNPMGIDSGEQGVGCGGCPGRGGEGLLELNPLRGEFPQGRGLLRADRIGSYAVVNQENDVGRAVHRLQ